MKVRTEFRLLFELRADRKFKKIEKLSCILKLDAYDLVLQADGL